MSGWKNAGPPGCLMHMVDDATTKTLGWFSDEETIWAAGVLRSWIERYGVPGALYTDWKNVYVRPPNAQERMRGVPAMTQLGVCARNSASAASPPVRPKQRGGWSGRTARIRIGW